MVGNKIAHMIKITSSLIIEKRMKGQNYVEYFADGNLVGNTYCESLDNLG